MNSTFQAELIKLVKKMRTALSNMSVEQNYGHCFPEPGTNPAERPQYIVARQSLNQATNDYHDFMNDNNIIEVQDRQGNLWWIHGQANVVGFYCQGF